MKRFLVFLFVLFAGALYVSADVPMPVCSCIEMPRIGTPIDPGDDWMVVSKKFWGHENQLPTGIFNFSFYVPEYPWSMPGTGWHGGTFPGGIPGVNMVAEMTGDLEWLRVTLSQLNCCDLGVIGEITPLFAEDGVDLTYTEDGDYAVYKARVNGSGYRWEYIGWLYKDIYDIIEMSLWEVYLETVGDQDEIRLVTNYQIAIGLAPLKRPWQVPMEAEVE